MARWVQKWIEEEGRHRLVPADEAAASRDAAAGIVVRGSFDAFRSPIDGTVIASQRALEDHKKKHGVVDSREFSAEWYQKKAEERAKTFVGERSKEQVLKDRQRINEIINRIQG